MDGESCVICLIKESSSSLVVLVGKRKEGHIEEILSKIGRTSLIRHCGWGEWS